MSIYRADVDGLRAVAIVPVVLFHAGFPAFSGGFVGVDVFFVISGYLITTLLLGDIGNGTFSIRGFYERRIRRLLPALCLVIGVTSILSCVVLMPRDLEEFGNSVVATAAFVSNFFFWHDAGYFAAPAETKPLLHTWSLAVEEQYYLIFPGILLLIRRFFAERFVAVTVPLLLMSFVVGIWSTDHAPNAGFYLLPGRFWELLVGSLLAMGLVPASASKAFCNVAGSAGLALILWSAAAFSRTTPFPGLAALVPCFGTALVIHAGTIVETPLRRLLSFRPVVFVGLISYSLYLWHWPLLVLLRQVVVREPTLSERSAVLLVSLLLAIVSWRYVEKPFRGQGGLLSARRLFALAALATLALVSVGTTLAVQSGWPQRLPARVVAIAAATQDPEHCFDPPAEDIPGSLCRIGAQSHESPTFLLWGDSHANAIVPAVGAAAALHGRVGFVAAASACPPLLGVVRVGSTKAKTCTQFNESVLDLLHRDQTLRTVILDARWVMSADGTRYKFESGDPIVIADKDSRKPDLPGNAAVFRRGLLRTLLALAAADKRIVVVGPIPEVGWRVPDALAKRAYFGVAADIAPSVAEFRERQKVVFETFEQLRNDVPFELVLPHTVLCSAQRCEVERNDKPLYRDDDHISRYGATALVPLFATIFE